VQAWSSAAKIEMFEELHRTFASYNLINLALGNFLLWLLYPLYKGLLAPVTLPAVLPTEHTEHYSWLPASYPNTAVYAL
jgi:hypothetical protein